MSAPSQTSEAHSFRAGLIDRYREFLPVTDKTPIITLKEGGTPLLYSKTLSKLAGRGIEVYLKYDGMNPTGSFKDRGMTVAVSKALERGSKAIMCASTGNTSASASAYAAKAGIRCIVIVPGTAIAKGKLAQAMIHGAKVITIKGNFDNALTLVKEITRIYPITLVNSLNPYRIEGQKTGAFEICDELGVPDYHAIPVGNAGNITAYWKGYREYYHLKKIRTLPRMLGFEAEGAAPIVKGKVIENPQTVATAIRIGNPASWRQAESARDESGGLIDSVKDSEIMDAYKLLADREGVFVEPASAASVAGILKLAKKGYFKKAHHKSKSLKIVCVLTGHGLKDTERAIEVATEPVNLPPRMDLIVKEIGF